MINLQTPINSLGYGIAGLNILKSLQESLEVSLFTIGQPQITDEHDHNAVSKAIELSKFYNPQAPCIKIWHQNQMAERIGSGKFIGFPIFELDTFSDLEKHHLDACDELMVCSKWAKGIVDKVGLDVATHVVPLGVDGNIFKPLPVTQTDKTIFFNCGKWEIRKGHDILVECFNRAFTKNDNVELWMMCDNPFIGDQNEEWKKLYLNSSLGEKIRIIPRQHNHHDVARLMNMADCGVFPARAEGWNLELLEMMSCGKHVIATNYSAHTEFCTPVNSRLVNIDNMETAFDGVFFDGKKGMWAELAKDQKDVIIEYMRDVNKLKQSNQLGINSNGIETAKKFNWKNTSDKILEYINE
tara:strand:- start:5508 stop:6572 length:1065 start_codon:yes stop_codon:yes gene_type:complete